MYQAESSQATFPKMTKWLSNVLPRNLTQYPSLNSWIFSTELGKYGGNEIKPHFSSLFVPKCAEGGYSKNRIIMHSKFHTQPYPFSIILSGFINKNHEQFISTRIITKTRTLERKHVWEFGSDLEEIINQETYSLLKSLSCNLY
jgi:hypothetical protein